VPDRFLEGRLATTPSFWPSNPVPPGRLKGLSWTNPSDEPGRKRRDRGARFRGHPVLKAAPETHDGFSPIQAFPDRSGFLRLPTGF